MVCIDLLWRLSWPEADRARTFRASSALLLGWLAVTIALGALGVYHVEFE